MAIADFGEGFYIFSEVLIAYLFIIIAAAWSGNAFIADAAKVLGGGIVGWGAFWFATRGQTSAP
jgi:hypothetical protein